MRSYTVLSLIIGNVALFAAPRQHSQTELDFNFGWAVGECLVAKCQIFRGAVTEPASQGATSVLVRADESIYGPSVDGQSVSVPYLANPGRPAKDGVHHLE